MVKKNVLKFLFILPLFCAAKEGEDVMMNQMKKGNLALSGSQQPSALFAIGQNIIDPKDLQVGFLYDYLKGCNTKSQDVLPFALYGINAKLSILLLMGYADFRDKCQHSTGFEDMFLQLEQVLYVKAETTTLDQSTIVANISFPTGKFNVTPRIGLGSPSFFLGLTYTHTDINWFYFAAAGTKLHTRHKNINFGHIFFYQAGIGHNIPTSNKWIILPQLELIGSYSQHDKINHVTDPNSGGNVFGIAPTLWISNERIILQGGVKFNVSNHLFGQQEKIKYVAALLFSWTFHT